MNPTRHLPLLVPALLALSCAVQPRPAAERLRVMTFNLEDVRTDDLSRPDNPRLRRAAATIQQVRPDVLLLNEMAYDEPGVPGYDADRGPGHNADRFEENYLSVAQADTLAPVHYRTFMAPSNTGHASGFDLDHDGTAVDRWPIPPSAADDGTPASQTAAGRAYGNDCWGFGTFPGQYAMALLVRSDLQILIDSVRTFRTFAWSALPDALRPIDPETSAPWYPDSVWSRFPLSSKSHWDVPIRTPGGSVVHVLASHPTPPAFDGAEHRNGLRNHDEIRFWAEYLNDAPFIVDDSGRYGGLASYASFVIVGDQNADPDEGNSIGNPVDTYLLSHPRVNASFVPVADSTGRVAFPRLDPDDTSRFGLRVDYVLPSDNLRVAGGRIVRPADPRAPTVSDHFPVWLDLDLPLTR